MEIKILHLIETLSKVGGAERRLINDLKNMDKAKFNNIVCSIFDGGELISSFRKLDISVHSLKLGRSYDFFKAVIRLMKIVKKCKPDIIHTQLFIADIYGRIVGKLSRIPVVSTIQSSVYDSGIVYFHSPKRRWLDSISGRLCNLKFVAVSNFVKESIIKKLKFPKKDIEVIYNHVDIQDFFNISADKSLLPKDLKLEVGDTILITVGKLNPPKGHIYLLDAMSDILKQNPSVRLLIVGDGPYKEELILYKKRLRLNSSVFFLGERNDVKELLSLSDIFVFPSLSEGLPLALLEAMAMGKPAIAFNLGPMPEVIRHNDTGILVEPKNSHQLAGAILNLINDVGRIKLLGEAARRYVWEKFTAEKNTRELERLYFHICDRR